MNTILKRSTLLLVFAIFAGSTYAQPADTVVIRVGKESKVTFSIKDKKDLETLKHYNFQALMDDMLKKLEARDSTPITKSSSEYLKDTSKTTTPEVIQDTEKQKEDEEISPRRKYREHRTHHSFNIDIGMNNYLEDGKFTDGNNSLYTVRPWGSWYVGLNSMLRTRVANKFFIEWGGGVSWYNFKFADNSVVISKDDNSVIFSQDTRDVDYGKSKLTVAYINISMVPVIDFSGNHRKGSFFDGGHSGSFRFGIGPYAGYRIDSYSKQMWFDDGDKQKSHHHDNFYLNNIRYGLRFQMGFRDMDIFFNYDMNDLFIADKGPRLNAFSFGITL